MPRLLILAHAFVLTFAMNGILNHRPTETIVAIAVGVILTLGQIAVSFAREFLDHTPFTDEFGDKQ